MRDLLAAHVDVMVSVVMTTDVISAGAPKMFNYLLSLGVRNMNFQKYIPSEGVLNSTQLPPNADVSKFLCDLYDLRKGAEGELTLAPIDGVLGAMKRSVPCNDLVCPIPEGSLTISPQGDAATCVAGDMLVEGGGKSIGNIAVGGVKGLLLSPSYVREKMCAMKVPRNCRVCEFLSMCQGGCTKLLRATGGQYECHGFKTALKYISGSESVNCE